MPREPAKSAVPVEELATSSVERDIKDDPLQDSLLPDDVSELKSMVRGVGSNRIRCPKRKNG